MSQVLKSDKFEQWREKTNEITNVIGNLSSLTTTENSNLVSILNSLNSQIQGLSGVYDIIGDKNELVTQDKSSIVSAINYSYNSTAGDLNSLETTSKDGIIPAINEIYSSIGQAFSLADLEHPTSSTYKDNIVNYLNEIIYIINTRSNEIDIVHGKIFTDSLTVNLGNNQVINSYQANMYPHVKMTIAASISVAVHSVDIAIINNGTDLSVSRYNEMKLGSTLFTGLDAQINNGNIEIFLTPNNNSTKIRLTRIGLLT